MTSEFEGIVEVLARRYKRSTVPVEDLEQIGRLAVLKALETAKEEGKKTYVWRYIENEMRAHVADTFSVVRIPRRNYGKVRHWMEGIPSEDVSSLRQDHIMAQEEPEPEADDSELALIRAEVDKLPPKERLAVVSVHLDGLTYKAAAELHGTSLRAMFYRTNRGLNRLTESVTLQEIHNSLRK